VLGVGLVAFADGSDAQAAFPGDNGLIAFTSDRDGNDEVYTMAPDGSDVVRLTTDAGFDREPAWSPDGTRIAFTSSRDGNEDIYFERRIRGEMLANQLNAGQTRRP
jgi:Tol biopolymer transport system component